MKQILQSARSGELKLVDVPAPAASPGQLLVQNHFSVVSPGTDRIVMDFARKSILGKARSRPDLVGQVLRKVRQEGPLPTYRTVVNRLDSPQPLGYSCAGIVQTVGEGVQGFAAGDAVACAGAGYANHAELVCVPENLATRVPDGLPLERAAFATLGAIALQGIRIAEPELGEVAVVVGLGLIGQLAVQLLAANGCRVLGVDIDERRIKQALDLGAEWGATPESLESGWTNPATSGYGVDFALVTASADDASPIQLSADLCRSKGRVIVVGAVPLELDRRTFYDKELQLRLSMSYGPGRYDRRYEEQGLDYPLPYVRWTENRNLQAFLALARSGRVRPERMDAQTVPFEQAENAYSELASGARRSLAVVFRYAATPDTDRSLEIAAGAKRPAARDGDVGVAFVGAGNYAKAVLLPALAQQRQVRKLSLVTATGPSAKRTAERFSFARCGTDLADVLGDDDVDLVFIATRHGAHAEQAVAALRAGKAVWLEKPMGLGAEQVESVASAARESGRLLALGYNRRFSSHARAIRECFAERQTPLAIQYSVAAGPAPAGTWITDPGEGGGRIIGELCHFVDLCTFLVGLRPVRVFAQALGRDPATDDSTIVQLAYGDGSCASIHYLAQASADLPKERFEVSGGGLTASCDNFKQTRILGGRSGAGVRGLNQDKGQATAIAEVVAAVRAGQAGPFEIDELLSTSYATFGVLESIRSGAVVSIPTAPIGAG